MSRRMSLLLSLIVITAVTAAAATACAEEGWSWSSWNPFAKKETATDSQRIRATVDDRLADARGRSEAARKRQEPSTWDKMNQGTKDFFGKTKTVLMPWSKPKKSAGREPSKSSFLTSWWPKKKEEPRRAKTVKDFLEQPMPY